MPKGLTDYLFALFRPGKGVLLSPFVFSLYIHELVEMMRYMYYTCKGTYVNENAPNIMILSYADDVVEGATTVKKLQDMTDVLEL